MRPCGPWQSRRGARKNGAPASYSPLPRFRRVLAGSFPISGVCTETFSDSPRLLETLNIDQVLWPTRRCLFAIKSSREMT